MSVYALMCGSLSPGMVLATSAALLIVAAVMTFIVRTPHHMEHPAQSDSESESKA